MKMNYHLKTLVLDLKGLVIIIINVFFWHRDSGIKPIFHIC